MDLNNNNPLVFFHPATDFTNAPVYIPLVPQIEALLAEHAISHGETIVHAFLTPVDLKKVREVLQANELPHPETGLQSMWSRVRFMYSTRNIRVIALVRPNVLKGLKKNIQYLVLRPITRMVDCVSYIEFQMEPTPLERLRDLCSPSEYHCEACWDFRCQECQDCDAEPKPAKYWCGGCLLVPYCSKKCQRKHWNHFHSNICARLGKEITNEVEAFLLDRTI